MGSGPVLLVVDHNAETLQEIDEALCDRYARHYDVRCTGSAGRARAWLGELAVAEREVALVVVARDLPDLAGPELLGTTRRLHPHAKRGVLLDWGGFGDRPTGDTLFDWIAHGLIDHYLLRPSEPPDELFHSSVASLLLDWAEAKRIHPFTTVVVGESWSGRAFELREVLGRCAMPHTFCLADSAEGRAVIAAAGAPIRLPLMRMPNGHVLRDPTNAEIALAAGTAVVPERSEFDLVVVGAGPAGLSAAVYGASEGFRTLVVDEAGVGGQSTSSSLIRNYLGFPRGVTGRGLAQRAYEQAWVFGADFALMQRASDLRQESDGLSIRVSDFGRVSTRAVLLATGASYRRLNLPTLDVLNGAGVFYGGPSSETPAMAGQDVYIMGGANSAGQAAVYLARYARRVTLVVRGASLAAAMSHYLVRELGVTPNVRVLPHTEVVDGGGQGWLEYLDLRDRTTSRVERVPAEGLFVMIGADPRTGWLPSQVRRDGHGFVLTGQDLGRDPSWPLDRSPFPLETSMPGVFAAGDVRHGAGRRVAAAVGEGAEAVQLLHHFFASAERQPRGRVRDVTAARV